MENSDLLRDNQSKTIIGPRDRQTELEYTNTKLSEQNTVRTSKQLLKHLQGLMVTLAISATPNSFGRAPKFGGVSPDFGPDISLELIRIVKCPKYLRKSQWL